MLRLLSLAGALVLVRHEVGVASWHEFRVGEPNSTNAKDPAKDPEPEPECDCTKPNQGPGCGCGSNRASNHTVEVASADALEEDADQEMAEALDMSNVSAAEPEVEATPAPTQPPPPQKVTLDVGISGFIAQVTEALTNLTRQHEPKDEQVRARFEKELADKINATISNATLPIKQMVAKNWVDLKPDKRDKYAELVHMKFLDLYNTSFHNFKSHMNIRFQKEEDFTAPEEKIQKDLDYIVKTPTERVVSSLKDYAELLYMSNIFLQAHTS